MKFQLPPTILSTQDVQALVVELRGYLKWYAHNTIKSQVSPTATTAPRPLLSSGATDLLTEWAAHHPNSQKSLDELLAAVTTFAASAPTITITLAAPASGELRTTLATWCRSNINPGVLISFQFNSTILGGMVIRSGSHIYDWSFRRQILDNRSAFPAMLRGTSHARQATPAPDLAATAQPAAAPAAGAAHV